MNKLLFLFLIISGVSCGPKKTKISDNQTAIADTIAISQRNNTGAPDSTKIADSLEMMHERDSFYAIKPVRIFVTDEKGDCYNKMISALIDTLHVVTTPVVFSDTFFRKSDNEGNIISIRTVMKSKPFTVEMISPGSYDRKKLFINGREMKPGREIDSYIIDEEDYINSLRMNKEEAATMKFGNKEYLYMQGEVEMCNGMGCGISYYLLYDPVIKKAMILRQLRTEFIKGYDNATDSPSFIKMSEEGYDDELSCFHYSGKAYRYDRTGKVKKLLDKKGDQYYFEGYSKSGNYDSIYILAGNFRQ